MIAFLQRKSTVGLALVSFSTYFGLCFNSPKKIDKDLLNKITKATILYPTVHFVSSRTQNFIQQENSVILAFGRDKNPHDVL